MNTDNKTKLRKVKLHRRAYLEVERYLLGYNRIQGYLHDLDKIVLNYFGVNIKTISRMHRIYSIHHVRSIWGIKHCNKLSAFIDWECGRFTKPEKQETALEFLNRQYPQFRNEIQPIAERFKDKLKTIDNDLNYIREWK